MTHVPRAAAASPAAQIELDKTSEEFRALHRERQALVTQWQDAIAAMKRRDEVRGVALRL